ncbi:MAG: M67 family metallopeptidase [Sphingomonas fennica]
MTATIATGLVAELLAAAARRPDEEICGLLIGEGGDIRRALPAANVSPRPADSFEIDPAVLIAALRAERAGGPAVLGCYHSHPRGPAIPSPRDLAAAEPGRLWLILAGDVARLWRRHAEDFTEVAFHAMAADGPAGPPAGG